MNDQNQNSQPDYSFIMNQQPAAPVGKPRDKFKLVIAGAVILAVIVAGLVTYSIIGGSGSGKKSSVASTSYVEVGQKFMAYMSADGDLDKRVTDLIGGRLYISDKTNLQLLKRLQGSINFSSCDIQSDDTKDQAHYLSYKCKTDDNQSITVTLREELIQDKILITGHTVKSNA